MIFIIYLNLFHLFLFISFNFLYFTKIYILGANRNNAIFVISTLFDRFNFLKCGREEAIKALQKEADAKKGSKKKQTKETFSVFIFILFLDFKSCNKNG